MIATIFMTPLEVLEHISAAAKEKRLTLNLSQQSLDLRSGVSLSVIKKFEKAGQISLESLLKLALVLDGLDNFTKLFAPLLPEELPTLKMLPKNKVRKRGRK